MPSHTFSFFGTTTSEVEFTEVGTGLYRLDEELGMSLMVDDEQLDKLPRFGDTIQATQDQDGTLVFEGLHARGPNKHFDFVLSQAEMESPAFAKQFRKIIDAGGSCQRIMSGLLFISIPSASEIDVPSLLRQAQSEA